MLKLFVPGRLCLFGEHTDWAGHYRTMNADIAAGAAIVTGIEQGIYAEVEKSSIFEVQSVAPQMKGGWRDFACRMDEQALKRVARSGDFFCYCAGVASYMLEWYKVGGVRIKITEMTLPMKSGLSSSAAICVLVARAFNQLYNLNLNTLLCGKTKHFKACFEIGTAVVYTGKDVTVEIDNFCLHNQHLLPSRILPHINIDKLYHIICKLSMMFLATFLQYFSS